MNLPLTPVRFLRYAQQQYPASTGVVCGAERFSYAQFAERAARLAGALRQLGIQPRDRVAFLSANCHRLLEAYYGVPEAGAILLPLNIRLAAGELSYVLNDSGAKALFFQEQFLALVDSFRKDLRSVESFHLLDGSREAAWLAPHNYESLISEAAPYRGDLSGFDENAVAELFYTSGTSANPKGVALTHRNIYLHALQTSLALHTDVGAVELHTIPLFHANGWGVAHFLTLLGGKHVMLARFDPPEVFRLIQQERAEYCSLVPTMAIALVNCPERPHYDLSSLKRITIGGAASSPKLVREVEEKLGCTCFSGYGLTETSPVLTLSPMKPGLDWSGEERFIRQASTGYAVPGVEIRVVDARGNEVPRDGQSVGEITVRGDGVMLGYWNKPEESAEALRGGWFHTGDMATWNDEGYLLIVDRIKDIIVTGGENVSSLEVEKALGAHPMVWEVAVIPLRDRQWGEVPKALVVLKPGASVTESELLEFCRSRLSHYKCPRSIQFLEALPKTGTGKILKRELRKKYAQIEDPEGGSQARRKTSST